MCRWPHSCLVQIARECRCRSPRPVHGPGSRMRRGRRAHGSAGDTLGGLRWVRRGSLWWQHREGPGEPSCRPSSPRASPPLPIPGYEQLRCFQPLSRVVSTQLRDKCSLYELDSYRGAPPPGVGARGGCLSLGYCTNSVGLSPKQKMLAPDPRGSTTQVKHTY